MRPVPHLMSLADLTAAQIHWIIIHAHYLKQTSLPWLAPQAAAPGTSAALYKKPPPLRMPSQSLFNKSIALLFSKRSTRTRVAAETATVLLGGRALFLGREDIQLGVNESLRDSARVIGGMCEGIFARVGAHEEIEELAQHSPVPVLNALSSLWHPTQVLADLLTLHEHAQLFSATPNESGFAPSAPTPTQHVRGKGKLPRLPPLRPLTVAYVGDSANVLHDMLVTYPRLGHTIRVASPENEKYRAPKPVWDRLVQLGIEKDIFWTADPREAVHGADLVVTDTWISMGQEAEKEQRLKDFQGYQVTEQLCREGGAKPDWKFMHCLPRKEHEVDDEVFYGPRSLVFPEADNRKWTIMALFDLLFGKWDLLEQKKDILPDGATIPKASS
ncbi:mitochondrial ornithine carbamoyltransferase [Gelatoporia subvermispora B]|uniref:ornithine carbamoyltransferase n=1 Tax=Ceriporiopsis subvermispora (strain B) TaxID=914234 RepID=M2RBM5_CERS8|nr:mitochondrial ornithine carbamoyltransferase [Gelatoporia subvermispora B]